MSMTNSKLIDLIRRLLNKSNEGEIDWEATANAKRFLTTLSNYSVLISEEGEDYVLYIVDQFDEIIEQVADPDLREVDGDSFKLMKELHQVARRNARGADKAIDDILEML